MKKFFHFFSWPLTALIVGLSVAACTDKETIDGLPIGSTGTPENALSFSTYMGGNLKETRAGATGSINTEVLKGTEYGFGVFGYYTGTGTYANHRITGGDTKRYPNFMYNQMVKYNSALDDSYVTKWVYSPIKYWPNDIQAGDVDDQTFDRSLDPAQGDGTNGGNISFFAYAPYVEVASQENATSIDGFKTSTNADETGILSFSGNKFNGETGYYSDPYVTYRIPANSKNVVDLLWGTTNPLDMSDPNVVGQLNSGVKGDKTSTEAYIKDILDGYTVNADMTKQTTKGVVKFLFKHALSKVGGSYTGEETDGSDDDPNTKTNGLMVVLDLDDQQGAEDGGELEKYLAYDNLEPCSDAAQNKYNTKVTVEKIELSSKYQLTDDGATAAQAGEKITTNTSYWENIKNQGLFDLATGIWDEPSLIHMNDLSQVIQTSGTNVDGNPDPTDDAKDAILNENIAEPATAPDYTKTDFEQKLPIGVTTVPKNVYGDDGAPFVFIPGTRPVIEISITYVVRTYDPNLGDVYSEVRQRITKNLYITKAVELNKQYNILIHLGLTSVKFTATVDDWDVAGQETQTGTNPETGEPIMTFEEEIEHVYLPRNVGEVAVTYTETYNSDTKLYNSNYNIFASRAVTGALTLSNPVNAEDKSVNPSHIAISTNADWVTINGEGTNTVTIDLAENISLAAREATITAIYDNVPTTYTIKQMPSTVKTSALRIKGDDDSEYTTLASTADYETELYVTELKTVNADGTVNTTAKIPASPITITKNYTLAKSGSDTWINVADQKVSIAESNTTTSERGPVTISATYNYPTTYGFGTTADVSATTNLSIKQEAAQYGTLTLSIPTPNVAKEIGATTTYTLNATLTDSNGKVVKAENDVTSGASVTSTEAWLSGTNGTLTTNADNMGKARTTEVTATFEGMTSNTVIVTQAAAELRINVNSAAVPIKETANSNARVTSVIMNEGSANENVTADCTFYIKCNDGGSWASIDKTTGVITVQANGSGAPRSVTVTAVHTSGVSKTRVLNQKN